MSMIPGSFFEVLRHHREWKHESTTVEMKGNAASEAAAAKLFGRFMTLCTCFGVAQGSILATITYTTTFTNQSIGSYCVGFFFGTFTIFSFSCADLVVTTLGSLRTFQVSFIFLLLYEILLWISCHLHNTYSSLGSTVITLSILGNVLAGIGFSLLCTSEAVFYQQTSKIYALLRGLSTEQVNDTFGGVFTMIYVPLEMLLKQAASLLIYLATKSNDDDDDDSLLLDDGTISLSGDDTADDVDDTGRRLTSDVAMKVWMEMFSMFVIFLLISLFTAIRLSPLPDTHENSEKSDDDASMCSRVVKKVSETPKMILQNKVFLNLVPINIAFGICGGFLYTYFYSETVSKYLGSSNVGYASAVGSAFCSISILPLNAVTMLVGKGPVVIYASCCFACIAILYLTVPYEDLGTWGGVVAIGALMGCGRAVWENTNRAIYADLFPCSEIPTAYANMYMTTGCTTFLSLFIFPSLNVETMCVLILIPSFLMWPGYKRAISAARKAGVYRTNHTYKPLSTLEKGPSSLGAGTSSSSSGAQAKGSSFSPAAPMLSTGDLFDEDEEEEAYGALISL